jgi:uncharacterized protein YjbJ (UPF0337 family)
VGLQARTSAHDDDIAHINGNREQLEGKIQARYGYAKDQVRKDSDGWLNRQ